MGACDGPSQEAVQTSTWSSWHVDATALSFWWSCVQQNICNRITDARCREDLIYPDGFNSTFNDRLFFFIQTLNLAFTLLFGWLFGFCGADKLTESNQSAGFNNPDWLQSLKIKEFNMYELVGAWGVGVSWTAGMGAYWLEGSWCETTGGEPPQLQQPAWAYLWPASSFLLYMIYFYVCGSHFSSDRTREPRSRSSAAEA